MVATLVAAGVACLPIRASRAIGQMPKPRGLAHRARSLTLKELSDHFHLPINDVARKLGLCVTVLKQRCREHGITRWPYRKVRKLDNMIYALETNGGGCGATFSDTEEEKKKRLETVKETRSYLLANPNSSAHLRLGKVKNLCKLTGTNKDSSSSSGIVAPELIGDEGKNAMVHESNTRGSSRKQLPPQYHQTKPDIYEKSTKRPRTSLSSSVNSANASSVEDKVRPMPGTEREREREMVCPTTLMHAMMAYEFPSTGSGCLDRITQNGVSGAKDRSENSACSLNGPMTELALSQGSVIDDEDDGPDIQLGMLPTSKTKVKAKHVPQVTSPGRSASAVDMFPAPLSPSSQGSKDAHVGETRGSGGFAACNSSSNGSGSQSTNKVDAAAIAVAAGGVPTTNGYGPRPSAGNFTGCCGFISSGRLSAFRPLGRKTSALRTCLETHDGQPALPSDRGLLTDTDKASEVCLEQRQSCSGNSASTNSASAIGASVKLTLATGGRDGISSPPSSMQVAIVGQSGGSTGSPEHDAPLFCRLNARTSGSLSSETHTSDAARCQKADSCLPVISLSLKSDPHPEDVCFPTCRADQKKSASTVSHDFFMLTPMKKDELPAEQDCDQLSFQHLSSHRREVDIGAEDGTGDCDVKPDVAIDGPTWEDGCMSSRVDGCNSQPFRSVLPIPAAVKCLSLPMTFVNETNDGGCNGKIIETESNATLVSVGTTVGMSDAVLPTAEANTCLTMSTCSAGSAQTGSSQDKHDRRTPQSQPPPHPPLPHNVSELASGPSPSLLSLATQQWISPVLFSNEGLMSASMPSSTQCASSLLRPLVLGMSPLGSATQLTSGNTAGANPFGWAGISKMVPWAVGLHGVIGGMAGLVGVASTRHAPYGGEGSPDRGRIMSDDSANGSVSMGLVDCNSSSSISGLAVKRI